MVDVSRSPKTNNNMISQNNILQLLGEFCQQFRALPDVVARHVAVRTEGGVGLDSGPAVPGDVESTVTPAPRPALPAVLRQVVPAPTPPALLHLTAALRQVVPTSAAPAHLARLGLPWLAAAPRQVVSASASVTSLLPARQHIHIPNIRFKHINTRQLTLLGKQPALAPRTAQSGRASEYRRGRPRLGIQMQTVVRFELR